MRINAALDDLNFGKIENILLQAAQHHTLEFLGQFLFVLYTDDLLVLVPTEDSIPIQRRPSTLGNQQDQSDSAAPRAR